MSMHHFFFYANCLIHPSFLIVNEGMENTCSVLYISGGKEFPRPDQAFNRYQPKLFGMIMNFLDMIRFWVKPDAKY